MSDPKKKIPMMDNLTWERVPGSEDYFDRADALRARFKPLAAMAVLLALVTLPLSVWVVQRARKPNPVQVYSDGRLFSGKLEFGTHVADEVYMSQMLDTVEFLLTRNEKGGVKAISDFVGPGVSEYVDQLFAKSTKDKSGYTQTYSITSERVLLQQNGYVVLGVRGLLSSRTLNGYQISELYFAAGFAPGARTDRNALGWRLIRLTPDPEGEAFYGHEEAIERERRLGLGTK
jgi:hypothetical protein